MPIQVGQDAPEIELPLSDDPSTKFRLSDHKGQNPVVVLFFPLAWTGVCTQQMCDTRDNLARYEQLGAKVVAISVDSPFALAKFKAEQGINFPLASDFNRVAAKAYGCLYDNLLGFEGVAKRSAFVIGKDGKVLFAEVNEDPKQVPSIDAIAKALA
jgi:peroxiredoxin